MTFDPTLAWLLLPAAWATAAWWGTRRTRRRMAAIALHSRDRGDKTT